MSEKMQHTVDLWSHLNHRLEPGRHTVTIKNVKKEVSDSGSGLLICTLQAEDGAQTGVKFVIGETSLWKIASFADASGLTKEEMLAFVPGMLLGRRVNVKVAPVINPKTKREYLEVSSWEQVRDDDAARKTVLTPQPEPGPEPQPEEPVPAPEQKAAEKTAAQIADDEYWNNEEETGREKDAPSETGEDLDRLF